jgi:hypothetical protein
MVYCSRLLKNAHLQRSPHPSSLQRTFKYASLLRISGALHLGIFDQPEKKTFSTGLQDLTPNSSICDWMEIHPLLTYTKKEVVCPEEKHIKT